MNKPYRLSFFLVKILTLIIPISKYRKKTRNYIIQKLNLEKKRQVAIKNYLKQYVVTSKSKPIYNDAHISELPIWQLWLQGWDKTPNVVQFCTKQVDKYVSNRKIIRLTENDIYDYISLPEYIVDKRKRGIIGNAHFSDIIRVCLLEKYGGTWIDATVLLTEEIPQKILSSNFFVFTVPNEKKIRQFHISSNWFIHAKPQHLFISNIKLALFKYWEAEKKLLDYFIFHIMFSMVIESNSVLTHEWQKMPKLLNDKPHALQYHLKDGFVKDATKEIIIQSPIHKMTYNLKGFNDLVLLNNDGFENIS